MLKLCASSNDQHVDSETVGANIFVGFNVRVRSGDVTNGTDQLIRRVKANVVSQLIHRQCGGINAFQFFFDIRKPCNLAANLTIRARKPYNLAANLPIFPQTLQSGRKPFNPFSAFLEKIEAVSHY